MNISDGIKRVVLDYSPQDYQLEIHKDPARYRVVIVGRRGGKTELAINELISKSGMKPGLYWYVASSYKQAKSIAWRRIKKLLRVDPSWKFNENELSCTNDELDVVIELKGADNEDCYSSDTEILTDIGWKHFWELDTTEKVLTLNPDTLLCEWKKPSRYIEQDFDGEFWSLKNKKYDFLTSPNHKYFVISDKGKKKFKTLRQVSQKDYMPMSRGFKGNDISDDEMAFMGIYLAEGTAYGNCGGDIKKRRGYPVFIAQNDGIKGYKGNKGDVKTKIKDLLNRLGHKYWDRGDGLEISKKELWEKLIGLGNKYTKFIPDEYKNASSDKLKILLEWLILGDGCSRGKARNYYTVSERLANDVQEIAFKCGYSARIKKKKQTTTHIKGRKINSLPFIYDVAIFSNEKSYFYGNGSRYTQKVTYTGKMYCVEVDNHTVLVRRNGKAGWSGNSLRGVGLAGLVLDECAILNQDAWTEVLRPMLLDQRGWVLIISTPKGKNWLYDLYIKGLDEEFPEWKSWLYDTSINKYISPAEIEEIKKDMPTRLFNQEILAQFLDDETSVFKGIRKCAIGTFKEPEKGEFYVIGADLAKHQDWTVLTVMNAKSREVVAWERFQDINWTEQKSRIQLLATKYNNALVLLDSTGVGDPILDDLQAAMVSVEGYRFSNESKKRLVNQLSVAIEQRLITFPNIDILVKELMEFELTVTKAGNFTYNAPSGKHDDAVISLCLAVWAIKSYIQSAQIIERRIDEEKPRYEDRQGGGELINSIEQSTEKWGYLIPLTIGILSSLTI